ncbi:MAG: ASCH domain-containing protein [Candidatus Magasanikbacteria bacterium]|nr:ASCH domain-containing protein [Candidatus Magasanikbacteria bacterium]
MDDSWVDALFAGYDRRHSREVNAKYKLIFVATDSAGTVLGVVGCTPKKGEPIKLMPCVAHIPEAYAAPLIDIPFMLQKFGHKLYIHCVPTVAEVMILQRLGWLHSASMPAAYHPDFVTAQWSNDLEIDMDRNMRVKDPLLQLIQSGQKQIEVRVGYPNIVGIKEGDRIRFVSPHGNCLVRITFVHPYKSFSGMLRHEDYRLIAPGLTLESALNLLRGIYSPQKELLGVYAFGIELVKK